MHCDAFHHNVIFFSQTIFPPCVKHNMIKFLNSTFILAFIAISENPFGQLKHLLSQRRKALVNVPNTFHQSEKCCYSCVCPSVCIHTQTLQGMCKGARWNLLNSHPPPLDYREKEES